MNQKKNDWQELDRDYFEIWDWILKECDGDWTKVYQGQCPQEAEEHRKKQERFAEICREIDAREQPYYFCWMTTINAGGSRVVPYQPYPLSESQWHDMLMSNEPLSEIKTTLHEILSTPERYYWLVSLLSALPESTDEEEAKSELEHARAAYRLRHHRYSNAFDQLLGIPDGFMESLNILRDCLCTQVQFYEEEPAEVACEFAAIKIDDVSRKRAEIISAAAKVETPKTLTPVHNDVQMPCKHYFFFFCETDFIYPHCRRLHIAPLFRKFEHVAAVDYFYKYPINLEPSELTRWPEETTHVIDHWSKEHVDAFKDFFINWAEEENEKCRDRFETDIDSDSPVDEKYLKNVYRIARSTSHQALAKEPIETKNTADSKALKTAAKELSADEKLRAYFKANPNDTAKTSVELADIINENQDNVRKAETWKLAVALRKAQKKAGSLRKKLNNDRLKRDTLARFEQEREDAEQELEVARLAFFQHLEEAPGM